MRFLHTADWHVGKTIRGRSRADEHRAVLAEIAALARARCVDFVLIAGDLFDTGAPTPEAEEIVYHALLDFADTGATVVLIAGNHDSSRRLQAVQPLLTLGKIHSCAQLARPDAGGVVELQARSGGTARIALLPFLSQRNIIKADALMRDDADQHVAAYADRAGAIVASLCKDTRDDAVNIVLAHAMVHGGMLGGGERSAHTVFEYSIPTTVFPPDLHYVALGHLHREQKLEASCQVRYCGSPLQLDFGEVADVKSVNIVKAQVGVPAEVEVVPLHAGRQLRAIRGTLRDLESMRDGLGDAYLRVDIDEPPTPGLAERVRELLPNAIEVRLVQQLVSAQQTAREAHEGKSPQQLFAAYLRDRGEDDASLQGLFAELLEELSAAETA